MSSDTTADVDVSAGWQEEHVTPEDVILARQSVLQISRALAALATAAELHTPPEETPARGWLADPANRATSEGSTHVANALRGARTVSLAAVDHVEVMIEGIYRGRATVAVWTLTRAALESLGRVRYLLGAQNAVELLSRHIALIRNEMKHAGHSTLIVRDVGELDPVSYVRDLGDMVRQIGGDPLSAPGYAGLATGLLEDAAPDNGSRQRYSQLSGVAHGELPSLQMFLHPERGLVLPRPLLLEAVHMLTGGVAVVGDMLSEAITMPASPTRQRWQSARDRSIQAAFALH